MKSTYAQQARRAVERFCGSASFEAMPDAPALLAAHNLLVGRPDCVGWHEGEWGYSPGTAYRFADGSVLTDDGRGYTTEDPPDLQEGSE